MEVGFNYEKKSSLTLNEKFHRRWDAKFREAQALAKFGEDDRELFKQLCALRKHLALEDGVAPFQVFSNQVLIQICGERPLNHEALAHVSGMGSGKIRAYGDMILAVIRRFISP